MPWRRAPELNHVIQVINAVFVELFRRHKVRNPKASNSEAAAFATPAYPSPTMWRCVPQRVVISMISFLTLNLALQTSHSTGVWLFDISLWVAAPSIVWRACRPRSVCRTRRRHFRVVHHGGRCCTQTVHFSALPLLLLTIPLLSQPYSPFAPVQTLPSNARAVQASWDRRQMLCLL